MACTTILVGKNASYDGSTMIARNDDSGAGHYMPKKFVVVHPEERQKVYRSVISHVEIELPDNPLRCTSMPNAVDGEGIWAASGVNAKNVAMTATETITSNPRVLGADPLVVYEPAKDGKEEKAGGIGEEDIVYGDSGYLGAGNREDAIVRNKSGRKIKYKINRRPSQLKKLSKSGQYAAKKAEHTKSSVRAKVAAR